MFRVTRDSADWTVYSTFLNASEAPIAVRFSLSACCSCPRWLRRFPAVLKVQELFAAKLDKPLGPAIFEFQTASAALAKKIAASLTTRRVKESIN